MGEGGDRVLGSFNTADEPLSAGIDDWTGPAWPAGDGEEQISAHRRRRLERLLALALAVAAGGRVLRNWGEGELGTLLDGWCSVRAAARQSSSSSSRRSDSPQRRQSGAITRQPPNHRPARGDRPCVVARAPLLSSHRGIAPLLLAPLCLLHPVLFSPRMALATAPASADWLLPGRHCPGLLAHRPCSARHHTLGLPHCSNARPRALLHAQLIRPAHPGPDVAL